MNAFSIEDVMIVQLDIFLRENSFESLIGSPSDSKLGIKC